MRLWHKDLIPYLPDLQLKGQWRYWGGICDMKQADFIRQLSDEDLAIFITQIQMDMAKRVCDELGLNIDMPLPTKENTKDVFIMLQKEV